MRVHVGRRIAKLRAAHGESLREAAVRTGVSHTTIARIEKGEVTGSFHSTLRKIAEGYGVRMEFLLTGRDPRQDFEQAVRKLSPEERSKLYFLSARTRIKMVLDFLMGEYPDEFSMEQVSKAAGMDRTEFLDMLAQWQEEKLPEEADQKLAEALSRVTGISTHWFTCGTVGTDQADDMPKETISAYVHLMKKAARAGIAPQMLEMAIDLLIMKHKEAAVSGMR